MSIKQKTPADRAADEFKSVAEPDLGISFELLKHAQKTIQTVICPQYVSDEEFAAQLDGINYPLYLPASKTQLLVAFPNGVIRHKTLAEMEPLDWFAAGNEPHCLASFIKDFARKNGLNADSQITIIELDPKRHIVATPEGTVLRTNDTFRNVMH